MFTGMHKHLIKFIGSCDNINGLLIFYWTKRRQLRCDFFLIELIWTKLHTYGEEFFKCEGDKHMQNCQKLKLYQITWVTGNLIIWDTMTTIWCCCNDMLISSVAVNYRYSRYKIDMTGSIDNRYGFYNIELYLILWLENILTGPCGQLLWVPGYDDSAHQKFANATTQKRTVMKQRLPKIISSAIIITKCINCCLKYLELGPDRGISIFVDGSKVIVQMSTIHVAWLHSNRKHGKRYDKYSFHLIFTFFCDRHTLVV